jgi:hypothetical protein
VNDYTQQFANSENDVDGYGSRVVQKCQHEIKAMHMQEKHEMTGQCLETVAASKSSVLRVC